MHGAKTAFFCRIQCRHSNCLAVSLDVLITPLSFLNKIIHYTTLKTFYRIMVKVGALSNTECFFFKKNFDFVDLFTDHLFMISL